MIIYNITTHVTWNIHDQWKEWMLKQRIPEMLATGIFSHYQLARLLEVDDSEGPTYAVQFYVPNGFSVSEYTLKHLPHMQHSEKMLWGDNIYSFSSLLEVIN